MEKLSILGVRVDLLGLEEIQSVTSEAIQKRIPSLFISLGSLTVIRARKDPEYKDLIENSRLVICDGAGVAKAAKILSGTNITRLSGIDLVPVFARLAVEKGYRIFLMGAKEDVIAEAARKIRNSFPGVNICGYLNGYFDIINDEKVKETIKKHSPDILLLGLGQPKQEKWLSSRLKELNVPVVMGVGGSFDVLAGNKKRVPGFFRKLGLEWLVRMILEPWRAKRNLALVLFVLLVIKEKIIGGKEKNG